MGNTCSAAPSKGQLTALWHEEELHPVEQLEDVSEVRWLLVFARTSGQQ